MAFVLSARLSVAPDLSSISKTQQAIKNALKGASTTAKINIPKGATNELNTLTRATQKSSKAFLSQSSNIEKANARMRAYLVGGVSLVAVLNKLRQGFDSLVTYQQKFIETSQLLKVGLNSKEIQNLSDAIRKTAVGVGVSSDALADLQNKLLSANVSATDFKGSLNFLAKALQNAQYNGDATQLADNYILLSQGLKQSAPQIRKSISSIANVAKESAANVGSISSALQKSGGVMRNLGQDFNTTNAIIASMIESTRQSGETVGVALKSILLSMSSSPKAQKAMADLGVSFFDSSGKAKNLLETLKQLSVAFSGLSDEQKAQTLVAISGGKYQVNMMASLLASVQRAAQLYEVSARGMSEIDNDSARAQESLAVKIQKTEEQFKKLFSTIERSGAFSLMLDALRGIVNSLNQLLPLLVAISAQKIMGNKSIGGGGMNVPLAIAPTRRNGFHSNGKVGTVSKVSGNLPMGNGGYVQRIEPPKPVVGRAYYKPQRLRNYSDGALDLRSDVNRYNHIQGNYIPRQRNIQPLLSSSSITQPFKSANRYLSSKDGSTGTALGGVALLAMAGNMEATSESMVMLSTQTTALGAGFIALSQGLSPVQSAIVMFITGIAKMGQAISEYEEKLSREAISKPTAKLSKALENEKMLGGKSSFIARQRVQDITRNLYAEKARTQEAMGFSEYAIKNASNLVSGRWNETGSGLIDAEANKKLEVFREELANVKPEFDKIVQSFIDSKQPMENWKKYSNGILRDVENGLRLIAEANGDSQFTMERYLRSMNMQTRAQINAAKATETAAQKAEKLKKAEENFATFVDKFEKGMGQRGEVISSNRTLAIAENDYERQKAAFSGTKYNDSDFSKRLQEYTAKQQGGSADPKALGARLQALASVTTKNESQFRAINAASSLTIEALKTLATTGAGAASVLDRLSDVNAVLDDKYGFAERVLGAGNDESYAIGRGHYAAKVAAQDPKKIWGMGEGARRDMFDYLNMSGEIDDVVKGVKNKDLKKQMVEKLFPNYFKPEKTEKAALEKQALQISATGIEAQRQLVQYETTMYNNFVKNHGVILNQFLTGLAYILGKNGPPTDTPTPMNGNNAGRMHNTNPFGQQTPTMYYTGQFNHNVNVTITGAMVFQQLMPQIQQLIIQTTNAAIRNYTQRNGLWNR